MTLLARVSKPPFPWVAMVLIPLAFLVAGVVRAVPFRDDVSTELTPGDDWLTYKLNALNILSEGLALPAVREHYRRPAGFLYNYFVAGVFGMLGVNSSFVYVIQSAMLGASISLMYLAFRRYLTPTGGSVFLVAGCLFMTVDVFRYYSFRLLSENLLVFLLPPLFWLITRSHERRSLVAAGAAGLMGGLAVLTRPNLALFVPAVCVLLLAYTRPRSPRFGLLPLTLALTFLLAMSVMPIRNYAATGHPTVHLLKVRTDPASRNLPVLRRAIDATNFYGRKALFAVGVGPMLVSDYRVRVHWLAMWSGFLVFAGIAAVRRRLEFWQALLIVFICLYLGPLIAVAEIENYGFRMIAPAVPAVLLLAINGGELAGHALGARRREPIAEPAQ